MNSPASGSEQETDPAAAYGQLHPRIQEWVWKQGWKYLRNTQAQAVAPIMAADRDVIISAATASGKTEAAWIPICSVLAAQVDSGTGLPGVKALCVSPLKALINDQYGRLESLGAAAGVPVHRRHGDVPGSARKALRDGPDGILLITPESLEALFVNQGSTVTKLLGGLEYVVIDELHSFIGSERGAQLQSLLHRVELAIRRRVPRVGLSATLSNLSIAAQFLRPEASSTVTLIGATDDDRAELKLQLRGYLNTIHSPTLQTQDDWDELSDGTTKAEIGNHLFETLRGKDNLVFANSRANVETYADILQQISDSRRVPNEFLPHHGSLSKEFREDVEERLRSRVNPTTAICTSTLEMGIDIGSADSVAQIGSPGGVSAIRQRLGRSGRREDPAVLRLYISEEEIDDRTPPVDQLRSETLETVAIVELMLARWYEPPNVDSLHLSTLVQQILSTIAQHGGAAPAQLFSALCVSGPFRCVPAPMFSELLHCMGHANLLIQATDGLLLPGIAGERLINHYSFYAAFESSEEYRLVAAGRTLGSIPIDQPLLAGGLLIFAGRRWIIRNVHLDAKVIEVEPSKGGRPPSFSSKGPLIADGIRKEMRRFYETTDVPAYLDNTAQRLLLEGRAAYRRLGLDKATIVPWGDETILFPWAGDRVMNTLAVLLSVNGIDTSLDGIALNCAHTSPSILRTVLDELAASDLPDGITLAQNVAAKVQDKHDKYLSEELLNSAYAAKNLDLPSTKETISRLTP